MALPPPIHVAAYRGKLEEVLRLIYQDPQVVNSTDFLGCTPLNWACDKGHVSVVAALVDHGANINHQNRGGYTALYGACYEGRVPVVELLMGKGANPKLPNHIGWTALIAAIVEGHVGVVACLVHHPSVLSTINHRDGGGRTSLYHACREGYPDIVNMLLEAGADPTIRSNDGTTAMDIATERGKQGCVSLLKEWDRSYSITKARLLYDAFCRYHQDNNGASAASSSDSSGNGQPSSASNKRPRVEAAIPTYLKGRMEGGQPLPKVEMVDAHEEGSLVESVLEYVICGGLKSELFVELMEMMGKTGSREKGEEEEEERYEEEDDDNDDDDGSEDEEEEED